MTQYSTLNVKLFYLLLNKSGIKNGAEVTLNLASNVIINSKSETNFPYKVLTNTQVSRLHKAFANNSPSNIKLSKNLTV